MGDVLEPLRRDSTPERIAAQLRSGIVSGRLAPGQALREVEIARQLGVSRGPVREAFQRLIQEGLLEAHPARGVFVPQLAADDIADLYLARGAVEISAAQLLASSGTPEAFADLSAALAELRAAPADDWNELANLDLQLHEVLVRAPGASGWPGCSARWRPRPGCAWSRWSPSTPSGPTWSSSTRRSWRRLRRGTRRPRPALLERHMSGLRAAAGRIRPRVLSRPGTAQAGLSRCRPETTWVASSRYP